MFHEAPASQICVGVGIEMQRGTGGYTRLMRREAPLPGLVKFIDSRGLEVTAREDEIFSYSTNACLGVRVNDEVARAFRQIVTAGWGNMSDGDVEAPCGHFAAVSIEPNEMRELMDAVFEDEANRPTIYPGDYLVCEDSDGNTEVYEYLSTAALMRVYKQLQTDFALWSPTCPSCGEEGTTHERHQFPRDNRHKCAACGHIWDPTGEYEKDDTLTPATVEQCQCHPCHVAGRPYVEDRHDSENCWEDFGELEDNEGTDEKLYLVCGDCGEVFDDLRPAFLHDDVLWSIKPESEAL